MKKQSQYPFRLWRILKQKKITLEELQYISEQDFKKWRSVGIGTYEFACSRLKALGLTWGEYPYDFYIQHREECQQGHISRMLEILERTKEQKPAETADYKLQYSTEDTACDQQCLRTDVAKAIMIKLAGRTFRQVERKDQFGVPYPDWETSCPPHIMAKRAVELADALIEELKRK